MKFTLLPKLILSPVGSVSKWLSSSTEFRDSIHSGSTSPSQMIQLSTSSGSFTTCLAEAVSTPSVNSRVSLFMFPSSCDRGIDFGFITCTFTCVPNFSCARFNTLQIVVYHLNTKELPFRTPTAPLSQPRSSASWPRRTAEF